MKKPWHDTAKKAWAAGKSADVILDALADEGYLVPQTSFTDYRKRFPEDFVPRATSGVRTTERGGRHRQPVLDVNARDPMARVRAALA